MKKFITFVLTAAMAVSALGVTVFAEDTAPAETPAATEAEKDDKAPAADENAAPVEPAEGDKAEDPAAPTEPAAPAEGDKADAAAPAEGDGNTDAAAPAEGENAADPDPVLDAPETPAEPAAPVAAPAAKATARPANAKVVIDGKEVAFAAYNIDGNNYFKLRDLAAALDGTDAEFDVVYDTELKAIKLTKKSSATPDVYTGDGKIDATIASGAKEATLSTRRIILPTGAWMDATDAKMTGYNIDGFTYFKLREVADVIIFQVDWDKEAKVITITTSDDLGDDEVIRTTATEFKFELAAEEERIVENLIFNEDVTVSGDFGTIIFENCEFNGNIINTAEQFTKVVIPEGTTVKGNCVFKNTVKEATMDYPVPKFISPNTLNVVCEDCIGAYVSDGTENNVVFNGETYSIADVESFFDADTNALVPYEEQEVSAIFVAQWWENGELKKVIFCE